jgi:hypothetical protein
VSAQQLTDAYRQTMRLQINEMEKKWHQQIMQA